MSASVIVSSEFIPNGNNGVFLHVKSEESTPRIWSKWYQNVDTASDDVERLGLGEVVDIISHGLSITIRRRLVEKATIDPDKLVNFSFTLDSYAALGFVKN
jgi:hypothetical protein